MSDKKRIKSPYCTNCGKVLQQDENYCPYCGQENDNKRQSFGHVMTHLVLDFLHIDSKIVKSVPALLFKPAYLTKEYLKGKRQRYLDPIKMFITIVVVYFVLASFSYDGKLPDSVTVQTDSTSVEGDTTVVFDEGPFKINVSNPDQPVTLIDSAGNIQNNISVSDPEYIKMRDLVGRGVTDTREVLDSLNVEPSVWNMFFYSQAIKFTKMDFNDFRKFLVAKLPWFIFLLMPVFALLLKLLYIRKDFLYIDHLIFAFHLHAFFFLTGIFFLIVLMITGHEITNWLLILTALYIILAFRNFYKQSWVKTLSKIFLLWLMYLASAMLFFIFSTLIVFVIY